MPRSGYSDQKCGCKQQADTAVTLVVSRLHVTPRARAKTRTLYLCGDCLAAWKRPAARKARASVLDAIAAAVRELPPPRSW
jgi:hypothetical protein